VRWGVCRPGASLTRSSPSRQSTAARLRDEVEIDSGLAAVECVLPPAEERQLRGLGPWFLDLPGSADERRDPGPGARAGPARGGWLTDGRQQSGARPGAVDVSARLDPTRFGVPPWRPDAPAERLAVAASTHAALAATPQEMREVPLAYRARFPSRPRRSGSSPAAAAPQRSAARRDRRGRGVPRMPRASCGRRRGPRRLPRGWRCRRSAWSFLDARCAAVFEPSAPWGCGREEALSAALRSTRGARLRQPADGR